MNSYVSDMLVFKGNSKCTIQVRMNEMVKIAVDMMGGDDAPGIVLDAVKKAVEDFKDLEIILLVTNHNTI